MDYFDVVFDGPPGPTPGRFVEVENPDGASIGRGEWIHRTDGYWVLRFTTKDRPAHDGARDAFQDFRLAAENFVVDYVDDPPPGAACNALRKMLEITHARAWQAATERAAKPFDAMPCTCGLGRIKQQETWQHALLCPVGIAAAIREGEK